MRNAFFSFGVNGSLEKVCDALPTDFHSEHWLDHLILLSSLEDNCLTGFSCELLRLVGQAFAAMKKYCPIGFNKWMLHEQGFVTGAMNSSCLLKLIEPLEVRPNVQRPKRTISVLCSHLKSFAAEPESSDKDACSELRFDLNAMIELLFALY